MLGFGVSLLMAAGFGFVVFVAIGVTVDLLRKFDEQRDRDQRQ